MTSAWPWENLPSDEFMLLVIHGLLFMVTVFAVARETWASFRAGRGSSSLVVTRGEQSMARLTGVFASTLGVYVFAIEVAETAVGHKSFLVVLDVILIGYLFLFNNWFRNWLLGVANARYQETR